MLIPAVAAGSGKLIPLGVLAITALRFATTGLYELTASPTWEDIAGVTGLVLCGLALYAALAMALEDARRETSLPVLRRGLGRTSLEGNLDDQLARIEREAGVREQQ
jgi:succinate-acetate transporter protein